MVYCETGDIHSSFLDEQERCSTWAEAEAQHQAMIDRVREPGADDQVEEIEAARGGGDEVVGLLNGEVTFDVNFVPASDATMRALYRHLIDEGRL